MAESKVSIRFGFLFEKFEATFSHGSIASVLDFDQRANISKILHKEGYLYPPTERERILVGKKDAVRTIPKSTRPANLFCLPASHVLEIEPYKPESKIREESGAFIVFLVAFLFETRLQFENWFIDGRIPIQPHKQSARKLSSSSRKQIITWLQDLVRMAKNRKRAVSKYPLHVFTIRCVCLGLGKISFSVFSL